MIAVFVAIMLMPFLVSTYTQGPEKHTSSSGGMMFSAFSRVGVDT